MSDSQKNTTTIKQEELGLIIKKFSQNFIEDFDVDLAALHRIYTAEFRHSYAEITALMIKLDTEDSEALERLASNFSSLVDYCSEDSEIYSKLLKLSDHINLENIRLKEVYKNSRELAEEAKNISEKATENLKKADEITEEAKKLKLEVIAVLGIFAAILLAFVSGLTFSTSVLANMHQVSIYRIVLISLIIGFILFNILWCLFYCIHRILRNKEKMKNRYFYVVNGIIIGLIIVIFCCWNAGWVEERNKKISKNCNEITINRK